MGRLDYTLITKHRWLWPLIELGAIILWSLRAAALKHEARKESRHGHHSRSTRAHRTTDA